MQSTGIIEIEARVHVFETDLMQVVHHANYFRWFEMARVEYLRVRGLLLKDLIAQGILFPIKEVSCDYKEPARYDDELIIRAELIDYSKVKIVFAYEIFRKTDNILLATGKTVNVFTDLSGKITKLPDAIFHQLCS